MKKRASSKEFILNKASICKNRCKIPKGILLIMLFNIFICSLIHAQIKIDSCLVAYYPFNGSAYDESGNDNDGLVSGAVLTEDRFSNPNSAYCFDGIDDFIKLNNSTKLGIVNHDFSVCAWVKKTSYKKSSCYGSDDEAIIGGPDDCCENKQLCLFIRNKYPFFSFWGNDMYGKTKIELNKYYFIVFNYSKKNNSMSLFINGKLDNYESGHSPYIGNSSIYIGKLTECHNFKGCIDDVRIYNRELTNDEIAVLYEDVQIINVGIHSISPTISYTNEKYSDLRVFAYPIDSTSNFYLANKTDTIISDTIIFKNNYSVCSRFSFGNKKEGRYDVILKSSNNDTKKLENAFTLVKLTKPEEPKDNDADGYLNISSFSNLIWLLENKSCWTKNIELDNDIDASESEKWNNGKGLTSITSFSGIIDGNSHLIKNLYLNRPEQDSVALISVLTSTGIIRNLGITNCKVVGNNNISSLVGINNGGIILNCHSTGSITGNNNVGGIAGNNNGLIKLCYNSTLIYGNANIGGLTGLCNGSGKVTISYNTGKVIGKDTGIGGIIGRNNGSISDCCNSGVVIGAGEVGGISGWNYGSICNTYNVGLINGTGEYCGALNGYPSGSITNSFWDKEKSGLTTSNGGNGKSTAEMKTQSTYTSWDFKNTWEILSTLNDGYPQLSWAKTTSLIKSYSPERVANSGSTILTFEGVNFDSNTKVYLYKAGQDTLKADTIYTSDTYCSTKFNFKNVVLGSWNILVEYPDTTVVIKNGLTIEETKEINLDVTVLGSALFRTGRKANYEINIENKSNTQAGLVPLFIAINKEAQVNFNIALILPPDSSCLKPIQYIESDHLFGKEQDTKLYFFYVPLIDAYETKTIPISVTSNSSIDLNVWTEKPYWTGLDDINKNSVQRYKIKSKSSLSTCDIPDFCDFFKNIKLGECACANIMSNIKAMVNLELAIRYVDRKAETSQNNYRILYEITGDEKLVNEVSYIPPLESPYHIAEYYLKHCDPDKNSKEMMKIIGDYNEFIKNNHKDYQSCIKPTTFHADGASSFDPNDKYGYRSPSGSKYFSEDKTNFSYVIEFENKETATAAAQEVFVTDTLDAKVFDISSFRAGSIKIGGKTYDASFNARDAKWTIDMRPDMNYITYVTLKLDTVTAVAKWFFKSVDPITLDWPTDPTAGFLPPNDSTGRGQGSVSFTINLNKGLSNETILKNKASIVFDTNDPIITPTWINTKDIVAPTSIMEQPIISNDSIAVLKWAGDDAEKGSGVYCYNLYIKEGNGNYALLLNRTNKTSTDFRFIKDKNYSFYVIAVDSAENVEKKVNVPDITLSVPSTVVHISQKWNDVLICDNSEEKFVSYQWYKNGTKLIGETRQFYYEPSGLNGSYYVEVVTKDDKTGISNVIETNSLSNSISIYPNPIGKGKTFTVDINAEEKLFSNGSVTVTKINGTGVEKLTELKPQITLGGLDSGVYMIQVVLSNGEALNKKLIVN